MKKIKNRVKIIFSAAVATLLATSFVGSTLGASAASYIPSTATYGNYFNSDFNTREEVLASNRELNEEIEGEGLVLLKNEDNALPLGEAPKVSVFGKNSISVLSGGSGSGAGGGVPVTGFIDALQQEGFSVNPTLVNFYKDNAKSGSGRGKAPGNGQVSAGYNTGETPVANYTEDVEATYKDYSDAALVVFSRISGEGFDLPRTMMWNGSNYSTWGTDATQLVPGARSKDDHYLQLDQNESDLLKYLGEKFDKVIVLLNTGSQFEVGFLDDPGHYGYHENIKGAIWMGYPGSSGNVAVAKALKGEINPSGKTVDTWARDFKQDPVWMNFANNMMECGSANKGNQYSNKPGIGGNGGGGYVNNYVIYKEGIYMGYRYYETRGFTEGNGAYTADGTTNPAINGTSTTSWDNWYNAHVVYPIGYGLSYTNFTWEVLSSNPALTDGEAPTLTDTEGKVSVEVKVTNTGSVAGKEVVELYFTAPYYDKGIEKAHVVLGGFEKTDLIQPGESDTVTVTMDVRDLSSYDWSDANENGFKGYELEAGDYQLKVMSDAHTVKAEIPFKVAETVKYETSDQTGNKIENRFDEVSNYLLTDEGAMDGVGYMSRSDFKGTFPKTAFRIEASDMVFDGLETWGLSDNPEDPWYTTEMPTTGAKNNLVLQDLVGVDYDDEKWDLFMDQLTVAQLEAIALKGSYASGQDYGTLGITRVPNADGPAGWLYGAPSGTYSTWCGETVLASTWNKELAREKGIGMGNEALWGNGSAYSKIPFWYAPAVNIHRSPFSGRNFEYYSEDGVLAGLMAASCIDGAQSKGLMCYVKHFGVNDQESNRCGLLTWLDEQSMREIYIRPFELCVTEGGTMAMMSSLNKIGTQWAGGSYELLTEILRNEWGFNGNVVTDSYAHGTWSNGDMMIRAGGNLALGTGSVNFNKGTATTVAALRKAAQGVLYSHANSMAMNTGSRPTKPRALISYETAALKTAVVNLSYTASVATAKINDEIYPNVDESEIVYTLAEGSTLPEGLQLMPNGDIVGTPVEETTYHGFKVVATFADDTRESSFALSIINSSGAIVYAPQSALLPEASIKVEYSASVAEAKIEKPDATEEEIAKFPEVTYSLADASLLPEGLTLSSDGIISGTPTKECVNY
ncbi:MAG: glycoside hydrolase family 3 C-terminal domain-containing protein, partial [Clostridia bacterium]|nr:glycoside hydrolase family 3 C-terminal domain-containing protein [Clostridia bacterium]